MAVAASVDTASVSTLRPLLQDCLLRARALLAPVNPEERLALARSVVSGVVLAYWRALESRIGCPWPVRPLPSSIDRVSLSTEAGELGQRLGARAATLDVLEATYLIGLLYTGLMPRGLRTALGAYYTPPPLCGRLLDLAARSGIDWRTARVLDPACGGGAFLAPVARRMAQSLRDADPQFALNMIQQRLRGFELDPFAAWMSQVFLDVTLGDLCREVGTRLHSVVRVCDTLEQTADSDGFDLVVGNPPYGRVPLSRPLRAKYARSLFGHANLYGVFTDQALRFTRPGGVIAYVTPTSFLAGEYFKALRGVLGREAPPLSLDFIAERKGVFADVLQEALLAVYHRGGNGRPGQVHFISPASDGTLGVGSAGSFTLPNPPDLPWLVPRTGTQSALLSSARRLSSRLADYGYTVSTGPLVWNRHKKGLRVRARDGCYPLVWAESVRSDGVFDFRAEKRNHKPYFRPNQKETWVLTDFPCTLVQRTTALEQCRRLIAAELPASFVQKHGAVVVENHLNMVKPLNGSPKVSPAALAALFNSDVVDQLFRCINGSVAVSAYELEALPLPPPEAVGEIEVLLASAPDRQVLEHAVERLYGIRGFR